MVPRLGVAVVQAPLREGGSARRSPARPPSLRRHPAAECRCRRAHRGRSPRTPQRGNDAQRVRALRRADGPCGGRHHGWRSSRWCVGGVLAFSPRHRVVWPEVIGRVQQPVDDDRRYDDTSPEPSCLNVAASHTFVRGGSRDAEDAGDFLDGVGGPGVFVGVAHVRTVRNMTHSTATTKGRDDSLDSYHRVADHSHLEFVTHMARCVWSSVWLDSRRAPPATFRLPALLAVRSIGPYGRRGQTLRGLEQVGALLLQRVPLGPEHLDFGAEPNVLLVDPSESDSLVIQRLPTLRVPMPSRASSPAVGPQGRTPVHAHGSTQVLHRRHRRAPRRRWAVPPLLAVALGTHAHDQCLNATSVDGHPSRQRSRSRW